jgi:hypothetical protein
MRIMPHETCRPIQERKHWFALIVCSRDWLNQAVFARYGAGSKVTGANALMSGYAKSVVSPGHLAASTWRLRHAVKSPLALLTSIEQSRSVRVSLLPTHS